MKALFLAAVMAASVTPVMAANGWNYGSSSSATHCGSNAYGNNMYGNNMYGNNMYGNNMYGNNKPYSYGQYNSWSNYPKYGSQVGYANYDRWPSNYNTWPTHSNSASNYYNYGAPSVRNTRYDNYHKNDMTFSPWSPTRNYNHSRYGY